jgi:hypothetical protein
MVQAPQLESFMCLHGQGSSVKMETLEHVGSAVEGFSKSIWSGELSGDGNLGEKKDLEHALLRSGSFFDGTGWCVWL